MSEGAIQLRRASQPDASQECMALEIDPTRHIQYRQTCPFALF